MPQRRLAKIDLLLVALLLFSSVACRPDFKEFVRVNGKSLTVLSHARVIDGTGAPVKEDQTIILQNGRIREIGNGAHIPAGVAQTLDLSGYTVLPGLVGMHDHLFYALPPGSQYREMLATFPKLYLAAGVTSIRTAGTIDIGTELKVKSKIDRGREIGPHLYLSSPYVDPDPNSPANPNAWAQAVEQLIPSGISSVKVYTHARAEELAAVIQAAHRHGIRVTGHLCAVGFTEAARLGIDNLEHGLIVDTEFYSQRQPGTCPNQNSVVAELVQMDVRGVQIQGLIQTLVHHHVAVTSTLPVFESFTAARMDARTPRMLTPELQTAFRSYLAERPNDPDGVWGRMLKKEMEFESEFAKAGGLLIAGTDPTGWGGVIAGFGDQRELELLVEAGFTPEQAIKIATYNGALALGQADRIGTVSKGKQADMLVARGNPGVHIQDIRQTEIVFKDGVGYDSAAILKTVFGQVGR